MALIGPRRPSVSRETRLLLATVVISLSALWVLARIRFPERPAAPGLVPPVLTQLAPPPTFNDLAVAVSELESRVRPFLVAVEVERTHSGATDVVPALRIGDEHVVLLIGEPYAPGTGLASSTNVTARDAASGLTLVHAPAAAAAAPPIWTPRRLQSARYLAAGEVSPLGVSVRPVFVGAVHAITSPLWPGTIWAAPPSLEVAPGTFLFSMEGALAGLAIERDGRAAIVPGETVIVAAHRLREEGSRTAGYLGVDTQPLTPAVAAATGAKAGVIVTWVDPQGPAAGQLTATDIVEAVDGVAIETPEHWRARAARLAAGEAIALRVRAAPDRTSPAPAERSGVREVRLTAAPVVTRSVVRPLGLTMRAIPRVGVEVLRVTPDSAAARAGIQTGDVLTRIADVPAPAPAQVTRAFATSSAGRPMLVAITRGGAHKVVALEKR